MPSRKCAWPTGLVLVVLGLVFASCGGGGGGGGDLSGVPSPTVPSLRILTTDAPFPFDDVKSAIVTVHRVELHQPDLGYDVLTTFDPPRELDLVELRNGAVDVLYEGSPTPGTYDAIRIIVMARDITILDDGELRTFDDFKVPSGEQTGIKVFLDHPIVVQTSLSRDVILDFDLGGSFVVQGNPATPAGIKGFHFKPVIRAINATTAGTLTFRVKSDAGTPGDTTDDFYLDGAEYEVVDDSVSPPETVASGASGTDPAHEEKHGYVLHPAVRAGTYELTVSKADHDEHVQQLVIVAANLTDLGEVTLAGTSGMIEGVVTTTISAADGSTFDLAVEGAAVSATPAGGGPVATDETNAVGQFAVSPLAFGTWNVLVTKAGYVNATAQAEPRLYGAEPAILSMELVPLTASVSGTVIDANQNAVPGATVQAVMLDTVVATATADGSGLYDLGALPTGEYEITATDGSLTGSAPLSLIGGAGAATVNVSVE